MVSIADTRATTWREICLGIPYVDAVAWRQLSHLKRWLIASRASVFPLTLFAVLFALCLAPPVYILLLAPALMELREFVI